jgi:cytidine deaminase
MRKTDQPLVDAAKGVREKAQALYSQFKVGSALEAKDGRVFTGCNIESSSYGLTICAERVALFKALSEGVTGFARIVVVADTQELTSPCGACRQLMWDFCGDLVIILTNLKGKSKTMRLSKLFPKPFGSRLLSRR